MTYKCVYCLQSITSASPGRKASAQVRNAAKSHRNLIDDPVETHVHDNCRRFPDKYATFGQVILNFPIPKLIATCSITVLLLVLLFYLLGKLSGGNF